MFLGSWLDIFECTQEFSKGVGWCEKRRPSYEGEREG